MFKKQLSIALLVQKFVLLILVIVSLGACQPAEQKLTQSALQVSNGTAVEKGSEILFPQAHGVHSEQGIEWWYLTANLQADTGETFGVQWTLFRTIMPGKVESQWWDNNLYFAHFAMQHKQQHVAFERFGRKGQAQVTSSPFSAEIDNWKLASRKNDFLPLTLNANQQGYEVALILNNSPVTFHGENGYSQKTHSGHASMYFSYPFLQVSGSLVFAGKEYQVSGNAWYDREWSASLLDKDKLGWDWFSLVDQGVAQNDPKQGLMLFCIRGDNQTYSYCSGTQIAANGDATQITNEQINLSVLETVTLDGRKYPSKWRAELSGSDAVIIESVTKDSRNQLTIPYWEGRVKASGGVNGLGYAELTGY